VISCGVNPFDIFNCENTIACPVELLKCLEDDILAELVHGALNSADKFVVADGSRSVGVKSLEQPIDILLICFNSIVFNCFVKFVLVKLTIARVIHNVECAPKTYQTG
jgi:hypothetical protein